MMKTMTMEDLTAAQGQTVYAADGDKIGKIEEIFVDEQTGEPEWLALSTGMLGTKRVLVPVASASRYEDGFQVPYSSDKVKATPDVDSDEISQETEARLYSHYGLDYSEQRSDTGLPEGAPRERSEAVNAVEGDVVRAEEELRVGTRETEAGRLRLHKWVETEQVEVPVELRREKARVTREPVDRSVSDQEIGNEQIEVTLREEKPVVEKETVAKERIGLEKDVTTERETVADEVRKERVEVEGDIRER
jgi:uncharacterized protein (TIGR02271 family)